MLQRLNKMLGIEGDNPFTDFALEDATKMVLSYCNITEIPQELETTVIKLAIDIYRGNSFGEEKHTGQILSVKRGDTQTTFADNQSVAASEGYICKYIKLLNAYRRLRW